MVVSLRSLTDADIAPAVGERVLVTGASGMLGRETVFALLRAGYDVRAFQRGDSGIAEVLPAAARPRFSQVRGSVTDPAVLAEALDGVDGIIHMAAKVSVVGEWEDYAAVNIEGTRALLDAARAAGIAKFLNTSSPSVAHTGAAIVGEGNPPASPAHARGHYARSKAEAELLALSYNSPELLVGVLRPHLVWGPGDTQLVERIVERAAAGRLPLLNNGTALIDTLYIDNAADAFVRGYERLHAIAGVPLVVTNGQPRTVAELMAGMCEACGVPAPAFSIPASLAYGAGLAIEKVWAARGADSIPPMTSFLAEQLSTSHWFDQTLTRQLLDWTPSVTLEEGYAKLGEFYGDRFTR